MLEASNYVVVAQVRARELKTRLALAVFIAGAVNALSPTSWPLLWLAATTALLMADYALYRPILARPEREPSPLHKAACVLSASLSATVYAAIGVHAWFSGGEAGPLFATIIAASGVLHVTLHLHPVRAVLLASALPHVVCLLGLPLVHAMLGGFDRPITAGIVVVGGLLFMGHMVVAVQQSWSGTQALVLATERANAERIRAERANAAKSDFLATVSHEIRTPMNAVISAGALLRRTELTSRQSEHVGMLENAGEVLTGLLTDVLDISKIEAGRMVLETADLPLRGKLEGLAELWRPKAEAKGVALRLSLAPDLPERVRTDPLRLQQILFNLLSNAVKFTDQGLVEMRVSAVAAGEGLRLCVEVADTGCGVSAEALGRIFNSFEQAEAGTTRRYGGSGLGLSISRRLTELMGGSLTAESRHGAGSVFRLDLPVARAEPDGGSSDMDVELPAVAGPPLAVLVAEDHEVNRRIVALLLEPLGCLLTFAENGEEAVNAAAVQRFDAVLMDMQMPVMDGLDATRAIRAGAGPNATTPIFALTANAMDHHRAAWSAVGVDTFLTKPIAPSLLLGALTALPRQAALAEAA